MNNAKTYIHPSGLKFVVANIPSSESCSISLMLNVGSIYENKHVHGGAHLIEHIMFKGTKQMPKKAELSSILDSMGGIYNAYTDYNMTCYHVKVQKKYLNDVIVTLFQMVIDSLFREEDMDEEKLVVVEELKRERDDPSAYVNELFYQIVFKDTIYERSVGGTDEEVMATDYKKLRKFWRKYYNLNNIVVSIAGNVSLDALLKAVNKSGVLDQKLSNYINKNMVVSNPIQTKPRIIVNTRKNMNQLQLILGFPTLGYDNKDKYVIRIIKCILAGNMSSRLFIKLRDDYGLAYSVHADSSLYKNIGIFSINTGVNGDNIFSNNIDENKGKVDPMYVILYEICKLKYVKVSEVELSKAKEYIKGSLVLQLEDSANICEYYGKQFLLDLPVLNVKGLLESIDKVSIDDIIRVSNDIFNLDRLNIAIIGNTNEKNAEVYIKKYLKGFDDKKLYL